MANPKRRHSNSRTRKRRTHDKLTAPVFPLDKNLEKGGLIRSKRYVCSHCKQVKQPHTICHNCGYYRGRQVISVER
ncbi:MAG: 50S ribosomal protein L32 [Candidatus Kuenenia sp.]|nr:50S ribosomal protein L32 [Candidatus Kuenenia sp.]